MKNQPLSFKLNLQMFAEDPSKEEEKDLDPNKKYLEVIDNLKKNTVSLEKYNELEAQNKQLLDAVINGNSVKNEDSEENKGPSIKELREDLFGGKKQLTNLEYWEKTLALRKVLMEQGETDPFVPVGTKIVPERSDFEAAQRVADVVQECIDYANGDSAVFTNELQRRTIEVLPR